MDREFFQREIAKRYGLELVMEALFGDVTAKNEVNRWNIFKSFAKRKGNFKEEKHPHLKCQKQYDIPYAYFDPFMELCYQQGMLLGPLYT